MSPSSSHPMKDNSLKTRSLMLFSSINKTPRSWAFLIPLLNGWTHEDAVQVDHLAEDKVGWWRLLQTEGLPDPKEIQKLLENETVTAPKWSRSRRPRSPKPKNKYTKIKDYNHSIVRRLITIKLECLPLKDKSLPNDNNLDSISYKLDQLAQVLMVEKLQGLESWKTNNIGKEDAKERLTVLRPCCTLGFLNRGISKRCLSRTVET